MSWAPPDIREPPVNEVWCGFWGEVPGVRAIGGGGSWPSSETQADLQPSSAKRKRKFAHSWGTGRGKGKADLQTSSCCVITV